jgi:hypothetical protein
MSGRLPRPLKNTSKAGRVDRASAGCKIKYYDRQLVALGPEVAGQRKVRSMNSSPPQIPVQPAPFEYDLPNLAEAIEAASSVKIVALGSSTTAGEGGIVAYPYRLEAILREKYANPRIDVLNRGVGGEEAPKERDRIDRDVIAEKPRLVIWQMGTNAVSQSKKDNPPSHDETIVALRQGIRRLRDQRSIDIILMDPQYVPAMLTQVTQTATDRMVSAIADVSREENVNLFRRFELMKGWHEVEKISFDRIVDPSDNTRLHDSDWATQQLTVVLGNLILARVPKPALPSATNFMGPTEAADRVVHK